MDRDRHYRALFEEAPYGYLVTDAEGVVLEANQRARRLLQADGDVLLGQPLTQFVPEPDRPAFRHYLSLLQQGEPVRGWGISLRAWVGEPFEAALAVTAVRDEQGQLTGLRWMVRDITTRLAAEQEQERRLVETERGRGRAEAAARVLDYERDLLQTIMEHTPAHLAYLDTAFRFVRVNSAYAQGCGYAPEELIGCRHFDLFPDQENRAIFEQVRDSGEAISFRAKPFVYPDQPERGPTYWDWSLVPVKDARGRVQGLVLSLRDVTGQVESGQERESLLQQLQRERALLRAIIENAPEGIVVADSEGRIVMTNPAADRIYARSIPYGEAVESHSELGLCYPDGRPCPPDELPLARSVRKGEAISGEELLIRWPDGAMRDLLVNTAPIRDDRGRVTGAVGVFQDISGRKRTEEDLRQRNRDLHLLNQLGRALVASLDLPEILDRLMSVIQQVFGAAGGAVWLWDDQEPETLVCRAAFPQQASSTVLNRRLRLGEGIVGWIAQHESITAVSRGSAAPPLGRSNGAVEEPEEAASLVIPLRARRHVVGVLEVIGQTGHEFGTGERLLIETLAVSAATAIENAYLYERAQAAAAAEERSRLARELHDAVSQTLFSASVIAEALPRLWEHNTDRVRHGLEQLHQLTRGALAEMRTLLLELRPEALVDAGLEELLEQLVAAAIARTRSKISLTVEGPAAVPVEVKVALYRIAQEGLNNALKHAQADEVALELHCRSGQVHLSVVDDGRGFEFDHVPSDRLGLRIIRERAEQIGGALTINSTPGQGTEIALTWSETGTKEEVAT